MGAFGSGGGGPDGDWPGAAPADPLAARESVDVPVASAGGACSVWPALSLRASEAATVARPNSAPDSASTPTMTMARPLSFMIGSRHRAWSYMVTRMDGS